MTGRLAMFDRGILNPQVTALQGAFYMDVFYFWSKAKQLENIMNEEGLLWFQYDAWKTILYFPVLSKHDLVADGKVIKKQLL